MNHGTIIGFDFGLRRIGIAVGQTLTGSARPLATVRSQGESPDWKSITQLIEQWRPTLLIVGLPVNMDGSAHDLAPTVQAFAAELRARFQLPVELIDERLSSHEAQQIAVAMGGRNAPASRAAKEELDRIAAQVILETWLAQNQGNN